MKTAQDSGTRQAKVAWIRPSRSSSPLTRPWTSGTNSARQWLWTIRRTRGSAARLWGKSARTAVEPTIVEAYLLKGWICEMADQPDAAFGAYHAACASVALRQI